MSFDIWLERYHKGEPSPFKREVFETIFLPFCSNRDEYASDPNFMQVEYPDGGRADIYMSNLSNEVLEAATKKAGGLVPPEEIGAVLEKAKGDPAFIQHVTFNHSGGKAFSEDMYKLAHRTGSVISWPDPNPIFVYTDEAVLKELPEPFSKTRKRLVRSGADISEAIRTS